MQRLTSERVDGIKTGYWAPYKPEGFMDFERKNQQMEETFGTWIPVDERLPEDEKMMLVTCRTKKGRLSVNRAWYRAGGWHGTGTMSGVIAWMPLPEPYKEEQT